ncbi:MAG TPA: deoxynucleoside kinase [Anaerolineales bacterium]|nr:deoxynucleoside kinase [Anaerolineales bacterium]
MNKHISIIGPSGVGKTTLVNTLSKAGYFTVALEQHTERPFQALAHKNPQYIFANQMDYLILRAKQERELRTSSKIGLMDGGLDLDFHGFTRLFLSRNLLSQKEYDLCKRFYQLTRELLPLPELIVSLKADEKTVTDRLSRRKRINIANANDTSLFNSYVDEWLTTVPSDQILELNVSKETPDYAQSVNIILDTIKKKFQLEST